MRVLMLSDVYFPRINGVSTSIETFRAALAAQHISVKLIAPSYGDDEPMAGVTRIPARRVWADPEDRLAHYAKLRHAAVQAAAECDLIHIQTPFAAHYAGLHAARVLKKPVIATYHTLFEEYLQHYIAWLPAAALRGLARQFSRSQCNALNAIIVPSTAMRTRLLGYGITRPLHVLPTGLPEDAFVQRDGAFFRAVQGIDPQRPVVLFVGRVAHEKNIDFLLQAFALARQSLPELLFLITGEGPAQAHLARQASRLGLGDSVRFLGYLNRHDELPAAYAAANAFVFASRTETQGLVLLEAMAQGCPVVALSVMGTADILQPQRGCRIAPDEAAGFAKVLLHVLHDAAGSQQLAAAARVYAREWSAQRMAQRLAALYQSLLDN